LALFRPNIENRDSTISLPHSMTRVALCWQKTSVTPSSGLFTGTGWLILSFSIDQSTEEIKRGAIVIMIARWQISPNFCLLNFVPFGWWKITTRPCQHINQCHDTYLLLILSYCGWSRGIVCLVCHPW